MEKFIQENSFKQKREEPRLKFNPRLTLIDLRTTEPRFVWVSSAVAQYTSNQQGSI